MDEGSGGLIEEYQNLQLDNYNRIIYGHVRAIHDALLGLVEVVAIDPGTRNTGIAMFNTAGSGQVIIRHVDPVELHNRLFEEYSLYQPHRYAIRIHRAGGGQKHYTDEELCAMAYSLISTAFNPNHCAETPGTIPRRRVVLIEQQPSYNRQHTTFAKFLRAAAWAHYAEVLMPSVTVYKKKGLEIPVCADRLVNKAISIHIVRGLIGGANQFPDIITQLSKDNLILSHDCCDAFLLLLSYLIKQYKSLLGSNKPIRQELNDLCVLTNPSSKRISQMGNPTKDSHMLLLLVLTSLCPPTRINNILVTDRLSPMIDLLKEEDMLKNHQQIRQ